MHNLKTGSLLGLIVTGLALGATSGMPMGGLPRTFRSRSTPDRVKLPQEVQDKKMRLAEEKRARKAAKRK